CRRARVYRDTAARERREFSAAGARFHALAGQGGAAQGNRGSGGESVNRSAGGAVETLRNIPRIYLAGLVLVTLIGSALRVRAIFYPLRHDESYTFLTYGARPLWIPLSTFNSPANPLA